MVASYIVTQDVNNEIYNKLSNYHSGTIIVSFTILPKVPNNFFEYFINQMKVLT